MAENNEFATTKVSNTKIKVARNVTKDIPVKGADWFPEVYSNIFLLAKKKSGKTTIIENILQKCAGANTKFIFVVSTINKDPSWVRIVKYWENKGHDVAAYDDLFDDGVNVLKEFLDLQKADADEAEQKGGAQMKIADEEKPPNMLKFFLQPVMAVANNNGGNNELSFAISGGKALKQEKAPKLLYPEYMIVCDDLGNSMRDQAINQLVKTNRHFKSKVILSAQNLNDLMPEAIRNIDFVLAFGRVPDDKMEKLREDMQIDIDPKLFLRLYKDATSKPYRFFYIWRKSSGEVFRKGFNDQYDITE